MNRPVADQHLSAIRDWRRIVPFLDGREVHRRRHQGHQLVMAGDDAQWRLGCLHDALRVLSGEPEDQIASIGAGHPDELGLGFEDGYLLVPTPVAEGVAFSRQSLSLLSQISTASSDMSGHQNADLWTEPAIRERPEWANVRTLARDALPLLPALP